MLVLGERDVLRKGEFRMFLMVLTMGGVDDNDTVIPRSLCFGLAFTYRSLLRFSDD